MDRRTETSDGQSGRKVAHVWQLDGVCSTEDSKQAEEEEEEEHGGEDSGDGSTEEDLCHSAFRASGLESETNTSMEVE